MSKSPDAFRTISEVAEWLGVQAHVLRFWESKFTQLKPVKRAGGRRYYRPADMLLLGGIKKLLHDDGLPIKEVQALLREHGAAHVSGFSHSLDGSAAERPEAVPPADKLGDDWQSSLELSLDAAAQDQDPGSNVVGFPPRRQLMEPQLKPARCRTAARHLPPKLDPNPAPVPPPSRKIRRTRSRPPLTTVQRPAQNSQSPAPAPSLWLKPPQTCPLPAPRSPKPLPLCPILMRLTLLHRWICPPLRPLRMFQPMRTAQGPQSISPPPRHRHRKLLYRTAPPPRRRWKTPRLLQRLRFPPLTPKRSRPRL
ncbi:MerR family transcriptional regulator [Leisingera sp. NJS201]|uniref:MerR family transcriptional regulator n=1 Tax=Leisingera sp. NJS201 TaxID=2508306 RepID=UPI0020C7CBEA|nr:MerR family transcriptional regulator [Leisingera sp. NJS201]